MTIDILVAYVILILLVALVAIRWYGYFKYKNVYKGIMDRVDTAINMIDDKLNNRNDSKNSISKIEYTEKMIEFIIKFVTDQSTLSFKAFIDTVDMKKMTKHILVKHITQVATEIKNDFKVDIDYDNLLVTADYIDTLIVDTTMYVAKSLWEKIYADLQDSEEISVE